MTDTVISVEHLSKRYQLGVINTGTFRDDLKVWLARARGQANPLAKIGERDYANRDGELVWALRDVNFSVQRGEALGIIGKNGAGKSTLLKILSRVTAPTEGHVRVKGRIASLLEVGTGFHPELTGRENIYLNGAIMGLSRVEVRRKLEQIIDFSGVVKYIDTPVKRYSSGMYVRLAFAVAAHLEPEILVVDEVLAVGDAEFQKKCLGKMGEVASEGRTVLFVSHNMGAIRNLCQQCALIQNGQIAFLGNTSETISEYKGSGETKVLAEFQPDSSKIARIRRIEVRPDTLSLNASENEIDTADGVLIDISYDINRSISGMHTFIRINTVDDITVISTGDTDLSPDRLGPRKPGRYRCQIHIPPRLLNSGKYSLTWSAGIPFQDNFDVEFDAIAFTVVDQRNARAMYIHKDRPGFLGLNLEWKYENSQEI